MARLRAATSPTASSIATTRFASFATVNDLEISSLRRFKDDVKSVKQGYECGIGISGYQDLKVGDTIEGYIVKEVERTE